MERRPLLHIRGSINTDEFLDDSVKVSPDCGKVLSAKYESLDYDVCENSLLLEEERRRGYPYILRMGISRWLVMCIIGAATALVACVIDISIDQLTTLKYRVLKKFTDQCILENCLVTPFLLWASFNVCFVIIAAICGSCVEPVAAGSGIPQVKCYLNGVKIPRVVRIKTLLAKAVGVTFSVAGGLAVGKEGPMVHSGAVIAAGVSQGKSTSLKQDIGIFEYFREDREKRDFVSGGAAAGVAAAFGAPVGGVLFSLEEGASFWNQSLTWRIFFGSMVSVFVLNLVLSAYHGQPGQLAYAGLLNFGKFDTLNYDWLELPIFLCMGGIGGLLGAFFNQLNYKLSKFRMRHIGHRAWMQVMEAMIVAATTATAGFIMIYTIDDCRPIGQDPNKFSIQMFCGDGEYNTLGALWFQTPEASVRSFFHDPPGSHHPVSVMSFFIVYFLLAIWTYGLGIPSGLFIPGLLTGAAWGRLVGMGLSAAFPTAAWVDPGKYALVGAGAMLGGIVRMTLSLTVILIEATGNISFGLPLMITLITAKWVGDYFNEGIYDMQIGLAGVPILAWEAPPLSRTIYAPQVMSHPVITFSPVEKVRNIVNVLKTEVHNGFPVVEHSSCDSEELGRSCGRLRGLILRSQLITLLQQRAFNEEPALLSRHIAMKNFRASYPRYPSIREVELKEEDMEHTIDLRPYMNPSPYSIQHNTSLPRIYLLFRGLGLRHLVVVSDSNQVVGVVTRKDLARFRAGHHRGQSGTEELLISERV
ncbi:unnamed protein product [Darwinula stevensoni]|uniref:Chloride channel protein n=1 Tax=Darwinula stevensoni TaxID=69355 RepID=A0A7R8X1N1_9CRUS|nr:unnamed protein product [Darwinula stevensoni]CAG0882457.1 unnamed protein product [Darwinula stevensoni]